MKIKAVLWSLLASTLTLLAFFYFSTAQERPSGVSSALVTQTIVRAPADSSGAESAQPVEPGEDDPMAREQWELQRHGFHLGVPQQAYANAMNQRLRMEAASTSAMAAAGPAGPGLGGGTWTFIGPLPMKGQQANFGGNLFGPTFHATGRVSAIAVDPAGNIYVGAAGGGVWLSKDGGAHFTWITKALPTQSIGAIAIDVTNTSPPTVYVGTGEGNSALDTYYGLGLFSSSDFGITWTAVDPAKFTANGQFQAFTSLDVPCDHLFAGTGNGVSSSRGSSTINECEPTIFSTGFNCMQGAIYESFPQIVPTGSWSRTFGLPNHMDPGGGPVRSLALGAIRNPDFSPQPAMFATIDRLGLVVTQDNSGILPFTCGSGHRTAWGVLSTIPFGTVGRSSVATGNPNLDQQIYAIIGAPNGGRYLGFLSSGSGGSSWLTQTTPCAATKDDGKGLGWSTSLSACLAAGNLELDGPLSPAPAGRSSSQAFYDQTLKVWPGDASAQTVFFAGLGIYRTKDGGVTWDFLAKNGGTHTDQHALAFDPGDATKMYVGNDGGAYLFNTSSDTWTSLNDTINAGQIQGIGPHPTDNNKVLAGFQDNGTQLYTGSLGWDFAETGDGGYTLFDHVDPTFAYHTFASGPAPSRPNIPLPNVAHSNNGGIAASWSGTSDIRAVMTSVSDPGALFYPPIAVDPAVAHRVLIGGGAVYASVDAMLHFTVMSTKFFSPCTPGCGITDIEFAPGDHRIAYAITSQARGNPANFPFKVFVTNHADLNTGVAWTDVTAGLRFDTGKTQVTSIGVSPFDGKIAYLGISGYNSNTGVSTTGVGHVFKTTDMGTMWVEADGGLPDIPVLKVLVDRTDPTGNTVLAGTDVGIFRTIDGGTTWSDFNLGMIPTVAVFDIEQNDNGALFAGTHGSGAWRLVEGGATPTPTATPTKKPTATPTKRVTATATPKPSSTPTRRPTATATRKPTATPTRKPTATATRRPTATPTKLPPPTPTKLPSTRTATPTATPTPVPGAPFIKSIPKVILVGGGFTINGLNFTGGSVVNFFVATSTGPINAGPLTPAAHSATQLTVNVPPSTPLGQGFVDVQVVNTDKGFLASNLAAALLQGNPAAGIPSLTSINGAGLAATSSDPNFATNNVETVVAQGSTVKLGGIGFDVTHGVAVDLFCACPGGKVGPFFLNPGNAGLSATLLSFTLPASGPNAPATGPGSFVVSNAGSAKTFTKKSNAVSVPIGQKITVASVTQLGGTITVNGTGFSHLTVINLFNKQGATVLNLGGLKPGGAPKIPLVFVNQKKFTFTKPAAAKPGASYVQALNPPYVPFTSSGNAPGGSFTLK